VPCKKNNKPFFQNPYRLPPEDNAAQFTPDGTFVEIATAIPEGSLPTAIALYVKSHYKTRLTEPAKVTDADSKITYEVEVKGKDLVFSENGDFLKTD